MYVHYVHKKSKQYNKIPMYVHVKKKNKYYLGTIGLQRLTRVRRWPKNESAKIMESVTYIVDGVEENNKNDPF